MNWRTLNLRAVVMFFWTLVWSFIGMIGSFLDPSGRTYSFMAREGWSKETLWLGGIRAKVVGKEKIDWSKPYVICANHQSQLDIPLLFANLPTGMRFLAKRSLFFIPIFGWSLYVSGYIPVDRSSPAKARKSLVAAAKRIKKGPSLLVFPEGTRSPDGAILPFKSGAFMLAISASVPVLPVAIRGSYELVPKDRLDVRPGTVELIVGDPIETDTLTLQHKESLKKRAHEAVSAMFQTGQPSAPVS